MAKCLVYSHQIYGPKIKINSRTAKKDDQLSRDRFNSLKNCLKEYVERVSQSHSEYEKVKLESNIDILDPAPDEVGEFFERIDSIYGSKSQAKSEVKTDDIGLKRRNLKNKSIQKQRKSSRSCD